MSYKTDYQLRNDVITKDGHTMTKKDIVTDLERKAYLEAQRTKLVELECSFDDMQIDDFNNKLKEILWEGYCIKL